MTKFRYSIQPEIFQMYPGYVRGVVIAQDVKNGASPNELVLMLRQEEDALRNRLSLEKLTEEKRISSWREAYRRFGAKPSEYRSSVEAMARRILRNDALPSINALVDIGNIISVRHLMPVGGHAIDHLGGDISLRLASGEEEFVAFGSSVLEHPEPGEVIFTEGNTVLTRRWTWRQGNHTLTLPETTAIEINVDGMPPVGIADVLRACKEVEELVQRFCHVETRVEILTKEHPSLELAG